jgi:hypothetical protein
LEQRQWLLGEVLCRDESNTTIVIDPPFSDRSEEFFYPFDWEPFVKMATAISRIYIVDGFTVAADGREINPETGSIASDREQKIFGLRHHCGHIACAVTGTGRIGDHYRISREIPKIGLALEKREALNVGEYAELLGNELKRSIERQFSWKNKTISIHLLLDGYINGQPGRAKATIVCGPTAVPVQVESQSLIPGKATGVGSRTIHELLFASTLQHEQLLPYWTACHQEVLTLKQSMIVAQAIIAAQCNPHVANLDPKLRATIGGHIHIAKVTADGFAWLVPPLGRWTDHTPALA